ncbi:MAG: membrane protein [Acidimicrobiales bacterium]|nr:MAG: membrane protein [Acidimicrobiales bacterium]
MSSSVDTHTERTIPYEPALDGLRGLSVAAVLAYHLGVAGHASLALRGGFLGVDAFFVLSGFLITSLLVVEWQSTGRISLKRFWARRARRLLPALAIVVLFVVGYAATFAGAAELFRIRSHGIATLLYFANWQFVLEGVSYFDQFLVSSPFEHMWSLAIEEQWYLLWPGLVYLTLTRTRSLTRLLQLCLLLFAVSAVLMVVLTNPADPSRVYFGTDTRAQSLLLGAAASVLLIRGVEVTDRVAAALPWLGFLAAAALVGVWWLVDDTDLWIYRGGLPLTALLVCLVIVAAVQPGEGLENPIRSVLSWEPLRRLGLISYGVYLWHWPLFVVIRPDVLERLGVRLSSGELALVRIGASLAIPTLSYILVERPVRRGALGKLGSAEPALVPTGLVVVGSLLLAATQGALSPFATVGRPPGGPIPTLEQLREGIDPETRPAPRASEGGTRVLVFGDSVTNSLVDGFTRRLQNDKGLVVWDQTVLFCELAEGPRFERGREIPRSDTCENWRRDWQRAVDRFRPHVSVLGVGAWEIFDRKIGGRWMVFGTPEYDRYLTDILRDAANILSSRGAKTVILTVPRFHRQGTESAQEWTQNETWRTDHINELFRSVASEKPEMVKIVDLGDFLCPGGQCVERLSDGTPVRFDGLHFSDEGAEVVAEWLADRLVELAPSTR